MNGGWETRCHAVHVTRVLLFLPLVLAAFSIVPVAQRWAVLLFASYVFYGFWHPFNLLYLGAVTLVIYICGRSLERTKQASVRAAVLAGGLLVVLGSLTAFKFYDFVAGEIAAANSIPHFRLPRLGVAAPAGFSFYAFSAASYLIDIYVPKQQLGSTALFVAYFPKIFAGPNRTRDDVPAAALVRTAERSALVRSAAPARREPRGRRQHDRRIRSTGTDADAYKLVRRRGALI